jgi:DNA-binding MarR family transcriptional regulator
MTKAVARDPIYRRRRFQSEIIELCVRWYLTYRLSYRDLVEMMAERGVIVAHSTILSPVLYEAFTGRDLSHVARLGPIRPSDLASRMQMDASTLTCNMQALVAQGWLKIGAGDDARSRRVEATEAGHAKRAEGQRAWKEAQMALNQRLGVERVAALHELLDSCIKSLDDEIEFGGR